MTDLPPSMTITYPTNPAIPNVVIAGLTPFQILLAAAIVQRIANNAMDNLEESIMQTTTNLVEIHRTLPES